MQPPVPSQARAPSAAPLAEFWIELPRGRGEDGLQLVARRGGDAVDDVEARRLNRACVPVVRGEAPPPREWSACELVRTLPDGERRVAAMAYMKRDAGRAPLR